MGGGLFISTDERAQAPLRNHATALAMIPPGLTPVSFFAPNPITQSLPATSAIFKEAKLQKRRGKIIQK